MAVRAAKTPTGKEYSASSSDNSAMHAARSVVIAEPLASLLGADGAKSDHGSQAGSDEGNNAGKDNGKDCNVDNGTITDEKHFEVEDGCALNQEATTVGPPPGYKRCFVCAHARTNRNCPLCGINSYQRIAGGVPGKSETNCSSASGKKGPKG